MRETARLYSRPAIVRQDRADGSVLLESATPLEPHAVSVAELPEP